MHVDGFGRTLIPKLSLVGFNGQSLHGAHAMNGFDQHGLPLAFSVVQRIEALLVRGQHGHDDGGYQCCKQQHHQRQLHRVSEQNGQENNQRNKV